jgi:tetratricopeptide (TPR) repeat protein
MTSIRRSPSPQLPPGLLIGLMIALAVTGIPSIIRHILDQQKYESAMYSYRVGDCSTAVEQFNQIIGAFRLVDSGNYAERSIQKKAECKFFQYGITAQKAGKFELALLNYAKVAVYDKSALLEPVRNQVQELFQQTSVQSLATQEVCKRLDNLIGQNLLPNVAQNLPLFYLECGKVYQKNRRYSTAIATYREFLRQYPDHTLIEDVKRLLAIVTVADLREKGAQNVVSPKSTGITTDGSTVIEIQNSSASQMQITFSGETPKFEEIEKCRDCVSYFNPPEACPGKGPVGRYVLEPGQYDIAVEPQSSYGNPVRPWSGTWLLEPGAIYQTCFFVVRNPTNSKN